MSAIAGYVGDADPAVLQKMLDAVSYRGDKSDTAHVPGAGIGYRMWSGRPGKSQGVHRDELYDAALEIIRMLSGLRKALRD